MGSLVIQTSSYMTTIYLLLVYHTDYTTSELITDNTTWSSVPQNTTCSVQLSRYTALTTAQALLKADRYRLLKYTLAFNSDVYDPLQQNSMWTYNPHNWVRATSYHGQLLLSIAFKYDALSMSLFSFSADPLQVDITDQPSGCLRQLSERDKINAVLRMLTRHFTDITDTSTTDVDARVCHVVVDNNSGYVTFQYRCCYKDNNANVIRCSIVSGNNWLTLLTVLIGITRFGMLFISPMMIVSQGERVMERTKKYTVKLQTPVSASIQLTTDMNMACDINLQKTTKGFQKLRELITKNKLPINEPIEVTLKEYHIAVNYKRMLREDEIPVGILKLLYNTVFHNKLCEQIDDCNDDNCSIQILDNDNENKTQNKIKSILNCDNPEAKQATFGNKATELTRCITVLHIIATAALILIVYPILFYIRLIMFYMYENTEVMAQHNHALKLGLRECYEGSFMSYLLPYHPIFIIAYITYITTAITIAVTQRIRPRFITNRIINCAFRDFRKMSFVPRRNYIASAVAWPIKKYGKVGCVLGIVYWPTVIPITVLYVVIYSLPTVYLTVAIIRHRNEDKTTEDTKEEIVEGDNESDEEQSLHENNDVKHVSDGVVTQHNTDPQTVDSQHRYNIVLRTAALLLCITTLYAIVFLIAECVGFFLELAAFTIMAVVVNASTLLKYQILMVFIVINIVECFKSVKNKYVKLNRLLFTEVKGHVKGLEDITNLPSNQQQNYGFKCDDGIDSTVIFKHKLCWNISNLVLFVTQEDTPRIPERLFRQACEIKTTGMPGPVHKGYFAALISFAKFSGFLFFVFVAVLAGDAIYRISSTTQWLITIAGGLLPHIVKYVISMPTPDIDAGTVGFKCKLGEKIKHFKQEWPIHDLPFEVVDSSTEPRTNTEVTAECQLDINNIAGIKPHIVICIPYSMSCEV